VGAAKSARCHGCAPAEPVDLVRPAETAADIVATLLYPVTSVRSVSCMRWPPDGAQRPAGSDGRGAAVAHAARRHAAGFRGGLYAYDMSSTSERTAICIVIEGGQQFRQLHRGAGI